ncbi:MAG: GNAT family N-acetyltransferase [Spirochaetota bacterium]
MATKTDHQGKGIGTALIKYAHEELKRRSVSVAVTYGDLAFDSRVGYQSLSEETLRAPLTLSYPEGWLGQSVSSDTIPKMHERPRCVDAFNDPRYW